MIALFKNKPPFSVASASGKRLRRIAVTLLFVLPVLVPLAVFWLFPTLTRRISA
ncbi:MAG: hypothetical protein LBJ99_00215 [Oscillospiraceae bacterium]|nr:hypothetical protein [Oscillospiraceae bacterium]